MCYLYPCFNGNIFFWQKSRYEMEDYKLFEDWMNSIWTFSRKCQREIHESVEKALEGCSKLLFIRCIRFGRKTRQGKPKTTHAVQPNLLEVGWPEDRSVAICYFKYSGMGHIEKRNDVQWTSSHPSDFNMTSNVEKW